MRKINGKVADDNIWIEDHKTRIEWGCATASDLLYCFYRITVNKTFIVQGTCELPQDYPKIVREDLNIILNI